MLLNTKLQNFLLRENKILKSLVRKSIGFSLDIFLHIDLAFDDFV